MNERLIWKTAIETLEARRDLYLVILVAVARPGPRQPGAKMIIGPAGPLGGTVGGGQTEADLIEAVAARLRDRRAGRLPELMNVVADAGSPGTTTTGCGAASGTFAAVPLATDSLATLRRVETALREGRPGLFEVTSTGFAYRSDLTPSTGFTPGDAWIWREILGPVDRLTILGGGHVSLALSRVMRPLGFQVTVIDERAGLATLQANQFAHRKITMPFEEAWTEVPEGANSYAVVMSPSHASDERAVAKLIDRRLRYLGLLASRRKSDRIRSALRAAGATEEEIGRLRAPIGLPIGSETPEEIAISIAAEIIQARRERHGG